MIHGKHHGARQARLEGEGAGRFRLTGDVDFDTVMRLLHESRSLFAHEPRVRLDLSGVEEIDSAGLALVIEWLRELRRDERRLEIRNPPQRLIALARIADVERLLDSVLIEGAAEDEEDGGEVRA